MSGEADSTLHQPEVERRRAIDEQFTQIRDRFEMMDNKLQGQVERTVLLDEKVTVGLAQLAENTKVTTEVRDLLITGRTMGKLVKWVTGIAASIIAAYAAWKSTIGH